MRRENDNRAEMSNGIRFIWIAFNALLFFVLVAMIACGGVKTVIHGTFLERECRLASGEELRPVFIGGCVEREGTYELPLFSCYAQLFEAAGVKDFSASDYLPDELIDFTQPVIVHCVEDGMLIRARNLNTVSVQELTQLWGCLPLQANASSPTESTTARFAIKKNCYTYWMKGILMK